MAASRRDATRRRRTLRRQRRRRRTSDFSARFLRSQGGRSDRREAGERIVLGGIVPGSRRMSRDRRPRSRDTFLRHVFRETRVSPASRLGPKSSSFPPPFFSRSLVKMPPTFPTVFPRRDVNFLRGKFRSEVACALPRDRCRA